MPEIVNRNEWRLVGLSRSGNHALVNWLLAQLEGRVCFLNCVEPKLNPFASSRPMGSGACYLVNYRPFHLEREARGELTRKDYLLYSHEDCFLGLLRRRRSGAPYEAWVGQSAARRDFLILRDPFNLFASRMHFGIGEIPQRTAMRIWKQHARDALGVRRYLPASRVFVSYNDWARDKTYRRRLAEDLGLRFCDAAIREVPDTAGGSSFDGLKYRRDASKMKVFERWREFADDEAYWRLFDDEVIELATALFGRLPAVDAALARRPSSEATQSSS